MPRPADASAGGRLRAAMAEEAPLQLVGVINAYAAIMAEHVGFRALYLSGAGVANASYGLPDLGMTTLHDVLEDVRRVTGATDLPDRRRRAGSDPRWGRRTGSAGSPAWSCRHTKLDTAERPGAGGAGPGPAEPARRGPTLDSQLQHDEIVDDDHDELHRLPSQLVAVRAVMGVGEPDYRARCDTAADTLRALLSLPSRRPGGWKPATSKRSTSRCAASWPSSTGPTGDGRTACRTRHAQPDSRE